MKILVVTSDSKEKIFRPKNSLTIDDFLDRERLTQRERELEAYRSPAKNMFCSQGHLQLMKGLNRLWRFGGKEVADLFIVSSGYGLINASYHIVPYQPNFVDMGLKEVDRWAEYLKIDKSLQTLIQGYRLVFFLLGREHLRAARLPLPLPEDIKTIFFTGVAFSTNEKVYSLSCSVHDAQEFGFPPSSLKGYMFKLLCQEVIDRGLGLLEEIYHNPKVAEDLLTKYRKDNDHQYQLNFS